MDDIFTNPTEGLQDNFLENMNLDAVQTSQSMIPDGWFDNIRQLYGDSLSDNMISQSVAETCDFFHIDEPAMVSEGWTTGVYPNNNFTLQDDVLIFNRNELLEMGITGKDGLDLVMTHEFTHRALQGMDIGFDSHQEELCCDFMAGVRAGLNGIDVSQMENSLIHTLESETHPAGVDRVESIESGLSFAQQFLAEYNMAPTFNECLDYFSENTDLKEFTSEDQITLRQEETYVVYDSSETTGGIGYVEGDIDESNISFNGYTQAEINRKIAQAEKEQRYQESLVRHHKSMATHALSDADRNAHIRDAEIHQKKANEYKSEAQKWKWTKPDKKE